MSLFPLLFSNWWEDLERPHRLGDQHFALEIAPDTLATSPCVLIKALPSRNERRGGSLGSSRYPVSWGNLLRQGEGGSSVVKADKDRFQVVLDVQQFSPEEINVKVVDRYVIVEGKHEEKRDEHGWVTRQFTRRYLVPEQCDVDQVASELSSDGVLSITAPRKRQPAGEGERVIDIEHTGKPVLRVEQPENRQEVEAKPESE